MKIKHTWVLPLTCASSVILFAATTRNTYTKSLSFFDRLFSLYIRFIISSAKIHESYLKGWVDLTKLDPSRVKIVDSFVELKGPLWIVPPVPLKTIKVLLTGVTALYGAAFTIVIIDQLFFNRNIGSTPQEKNKLEKLVPHPGAVAGGVISGIALSALAWKQMSKLIPKITGIYFCNWPFSR
jgi:hypothetical protein